MLASLPPLPRAETARQSPTAGRQQSRPRWEPWGDHRWLLETVKYAACGAHKACLAVLAIATPSKSASACRLAAARPCPVPPPIFPHPSIPVLRPSPAFLCTQHVQVLVEGRAKLEEIVRARGRAAAKAGDHADVVRFTRLTRPLRLQQVGCLGRGRTTDGLLILPTAAGTEH